VGEDALDELASHLGGGLRVVVEGWHDRVDGGAGFGGEGHVAQVDAVKRRLADAEEERTALFEGDVGGALDERGGKAVGDSGERSHGAGKDDHRVRGVGAGGDVGADVFVGVLLDLGGRLAEEFFYEIVAAGELELFGEDAEGGCGDDEIDVGDARVGGEEREHLGGEEGAAGSGDGEGDAAILGGGGQHGSGKSIAGGL